MKVKLSFAVILAFLLLCIPCLASLAEGEGDSSSSSHLSGSSEISSEGSSQSTGASVESSEGEDDDSDSSDSSSDGKSSSSSSSSSSSQSSPSSSSSSSSQSSSNTHRFSGDPVQGSTPQFSALELGKCDPDDGEDFELEPEKNDGMLEVTIRNTDAEDMDGNDNFYIDFENCKFWLPIEIPAQNVVDDNINSKLIISYGSVSDSVTGKVTSAVASSHILQTFALTMTKYDKKGQASVMNSFDGSVKFVYSVNSAVINQYNRDGKISLMFYDTEALSLTPLEYTLDAGKSTLTAYPSNSGSFFIINSNDIDLSSAVKLDSAPPVGKLLLYIGTFLSLAAAVAFAIILAVRNRREKSACASPRKP